MANSQPSCSNLIMLQPLRKNNTDINSVLAKQIKPIMYASRFEHLSKHISSVFITNTTAVYVIVTDLEEFSVLCLFIMDSYAISYTIN